MLRYLTIAVFTLVFIITAGCDTDSGKDLASDIEMVNSDSERIKYSFPDAHYCIVINALLEEQFDTALKLLTEKDPTGTITYTKGSCPTKDIIGKCDSSLAGDALTLLNENSEYEVEIITLTAYIYGDNSNPLVEPGLKSICMSTGWPPIIDKGDWIKNE